MIPSKADLEKSGIPPDEGPLTSALRLCIAVMSVPDSHGTVVPRELFQEVAKRYGIRLLTDLRYRSGSTNIGPCSNPQFRGYQQQDSHELLRTLLDGVREEEQVRLKKAGVRQPLMRGCTSSALVSSLSLV